MTDTETAAAGGRRRPSRLSRWLRPRRLATIATSAVVLGGGFGVLSHTLLATATSYTVDTTADSHVSPSTSTTCPSPCSLRAAIEASNNAGGSNSITVPAGTYNLTLGEIPVAPTGNMTVSINGASSATTIIHAVQPSSCVMPTPSGCNRIFNEDFPGDGSASVTLNGLTIDGGRASQYGGAGILSGTVSVATPVDSITAVNCVFSNNKVLSTVTTVVGGAIDQTYGNVTVSGSTFSNNDAGAGGGGAIFLSLGAANLSVSGSTFTGNTAGAEGGAIDYSGSGTGSITGSSFSSNTATSNSGGVEIGGTATVTIGTSTFSNNSGGKGGAVKIDGGSTTLSGDTFTSNGATSDGGAVAVETSATVTNGSFSGNTANSGHGGGIFVDGTATGLTASGTTGLTFSSNSAGNGGAVAVAGGTVSFSGTVSFTSNSTSGSGGALNLSGGTTTLTGSTLTSNAASLGSGGAIFAGNASLTMQYSRLYLNTASSAAQVAHSGTGTATANNNWWGTNAGPSTGISGFTVSVWQFLTSTASPSAILVNGTSTITATIDTTSSNGTSSNGTIAPAHHMPNGITVSFGNGSLGTVGLTSGSLSSGTASTTYTAGSTGGLDNVPTTIDGQQVNGAVEVDQPPQITSASSTTFVAGQSNTFTVTAAGYPPPAFTETGALPSGVTLNSTTGVLSGTPALCSGGVYPITITAKNHLTATNADATDTQSFTLTVDEAPTFHSANNTTFTVANPGTFTVTACGYPAPSINLTNGSLPSGVSYDSTSHVLSGTPASGTGGQYALQFTALNNFGGSHTALQSFTLTIDEPASITSGSSATFTVGAAGTFSVTTGGYPHPAISETGTLPSAVTLTDNGDGTATLAGTPAAGTGGTYPITIRAHNGVGTDATQAFTLTVNEAASVTSANHVTFTTGQAGTFSVTTLGFPTPSLSDGGATLPSGVTFTDNGGGTATLAGTPAAGTGGTYNFTITAHNGIGSDGTQSFTLTVDQPPAITSADNTTFTVGQAGTFGVTTSGFPTGASMSIGESGTLPSGVTFADNGDGTATLAGTPGNSTAGDYPITISASNGVSPDASQNFTLHVLGTPTITSANHTTFVVGQVGTFTVTTTGSLPMSISDGGATLPGGVTFTDNGNGSATLAGTPAAGSAGTYSFTITAHNSVPPDATQSFTLQVNEAPAITSASSTTFTVGQAGTFSVTTTGTPVPSIGDGGATLPSGVTFVDNGNGTATLSGTPAVGTGGTYNFTITAHNGVGSDATQGFTLTVDEAPAITSANNTTFTVGSPGLFTVQTAGFPAPSLSDGGATLPGGVTFVDNGNGTATLSGTPAAGTGGSYGFTITAHNTTAPDATQSFTLTVDQAPAITSANNTTFTVGQAGTFSVTTTGFPAPTIGDGGATLPGGVTFVDNGNGTATLSGTAAVGTGGTYSFTITAHNSTPPDATQAFTLTVDEAPSFTSANNTTFTVGAAGSFAVTTDGFPAPALSETGALPGGVTFVDNGNGTATLAGTPAAGSGGVYPLTLHAQNGSGTTPQSFTLTVDEALSITSANNTTFTVGTPGTFSVTTRGFPTPSLSDGGAALPSGVTFVDNGDGTATLSGTPAAGTGGVYSFTITAHNGQSPDATQPFTLTVNEAASVTSANSTTFTVGAPGTFSVTTRGFPTPSVAESGPLPAGVSFTDNGNGTGTLNGTPAAGTGGVYNISFIAHNGVGPDGTQAFTLTVDQAAAITSASATTFTAGSSNSFNVTTTGFPTPSISEVGSLPSGVSFTDNGNGTGTLSGTPATGTGGVYNVSFIAHNGVGGDATQSFTLTVNEAAVITSANTATFQVDTAGSFTVTTRGYPVPSLTETGSLPSGVTFVDNGNGTATLSGTPATGTSGTYPLSLKAHNGVGTDGTQAFTLIVGAAPTTTTVNATNATPNYGQADTFTATVAPVSPATGTPQGSVTFAVDATSTVTVTLVSGQAQWTTSGLLPGAHTISASYGGQTNTFKPSNGSVNVNVGCALTYTGRIAGTLSITGGSACVNTARISGGVSISGGANVAIVNSNIGNGLTSNGAGMVSMCSTSLGGAMSISNSTGFVLIGSNNDDTSMPCAGNTIGGGVTLNGNHGGLELGGNPTIKGAVVVSNNVQTGPSIDAENTAPEIEGNSIRGSLTCSGNTPAPTDDGSPNTVSGGRYGQCSAARF